MNSQVENMNVKYMCVVCKTILPFENGSLRCPNCKSSLFEKKSEYVTYYC